MKVIVRAFGDLIEIVGRKKTLELESGSRFRDLISKLAEKTKSTRKDYIGDYKVTGGDLVILVNGRNLDSMEKMDTPLKEGDIITLLPPIEGG